jgi:hypothetical protein
MPAEAPGQPGNVPGPCDQASAGMAYCVCCREQHTLGTCCCRVPAKATFSQWNIGKKLHVCMASKCNYSCATFRHARSSSSDPAPAYDFEAAWFSASRQPQALPLPPAATASSKSKEESYCTGITDEAYSSLFCVRPSGTPTADMFTAAKSDPRFAPLNQMSSVDVFMQHGGFAYTGEVRCVRSAFCTLDLSCLAVGPCSLLRAHKPLHWRSITKAASLQAIAEQGVSAGDKLKCAHPSSLTHLESSVRGMCLQQASEVKRSEVRTTQIVSNRQTSQLEKLKANILRLEESEDDQLLQLVKRAAYTGMDMCRVSRVGLLFLL